MGCKGGGWLIEKRVSVRPRHPRATQRPPESGVGPCFPLRGAGVLCLQAAYFRRLLRPVS